MYQDISKIKNMSKQQHRKGYTLIEVFIAVMFFALIAVGLSLPFSNSISLTVNNKNVNAANNLARSYLKDMEAKWRIQSSFDAGTLIEINNTYTDNGNYSIERSSSIITENNSGIAMVRRIHIIYRDSEGLILSDIFYDYNRPGTT